MTEGQKYHCGPKESPKFLRRLLSKFSKDINKLCETHDKTHSPGSGVSRKESDRVFLKYYRKSNSWIKGLIALLYYHAVSKFGAKHYAGDKPVEEEKDEKAA